MKTPSYQQFRLSGDKPAQALRSVRIAQEWSALESAGLVRFRVEDEQESYFDVYGEPEGYVNNNGRKVTAEQERAEILRSIEQNGCLWLCAEFRTDEDSEWQHADSIGMLTGYQRVTDMLENSYAVDLASSAIEAYHAQAVAPSL